MEIWKILSQESNLTALILEHFLELLQKSLPYEEKADPRDKEKTIKTATVVPLAVSCPALHHVYTDLKANKWLQCRLKI